MPHHDIKLMSHMVAGYPDIDVSLDVARALIDGGSTYLEVQFPFSDPSADGIPIQTACNMALENGFKVAQGFNLIGKIHDSNSIPIFIMSYASIVFTMGIAEFVNTAKERGASGLIIPDLMPGYDEDLYKIAQSRSLNVIPVVAPGISEERLDEILACECPYLYASLRVGITGSRTELNDSVVAFAERLKATGRKVLAGFGIQTHEQVVALKDQVHALVVGSALVKEVSAALSKGTDAYDAVKTKLLELLVG